MGYFHGWRGICDSGILVLWIRENQTYYDGREQRGLSTSYIVSQHKSYRTVVLSMGEQWENSSTSTAVLLCVIASWKISIKKGIQNRAYLVPLLARSWVREFVTSEKIILSTTVSQYKCIYTSANKVATQRLEMK